MISYDMLLDLPVKAQIRHKNSPDHWCCVPNKSGEFIALNKTVYRLSNDFSVTFSVAPFDVQFVRHFLLNGWEQVCVPVGDLHAFVPHAIADGNGGIAHVDK